MKGIQTELEMKIRLFRESWTKGWREIAEIQENKFFYGMVCR